MVELMAPGPAIRAAPAARRRYFHEWPFLIFLLVLFILAELAADHRHGDGDHQNPTRNTEGINGNAEDLENRIAKNSDVSKIMATDRLAVRLVLLRTAAVW
jgi:hypothetical protein